MIIRRAIIGDIEPLVELMEKLGTGREKTRARAEKYIYSNNRLILVLEKASRLLGYVGMKEREDDKKAKPYVDTSHFAHLTWISAHPNFRDRGNGSKLVQACDEVARKWGKVGIWLDCRGKVISFYVSNGYTARGSYFDKGKPRYVMAKILR